MNQQYGKENLDIKHTQPEWYNEVENCVSNVIKNTKNSLKQTKIDDFENQDLYLEEVCAAIEKTSISSAPSPEEKVFTVLIKKGGESLAEALLLLFSDLIIPGRH